MEPFTRRNVLLGRTADGDRVRVDVELSTRESDVTTTDHRKIGTVTRLSLMGTVTAYRCREAHSAGQIQDYLDDITECAAGWTVGKIARLSQIWQSWHLNDVNAACDHQTVIWEDAPYRRPSLDKTAPCPVTGYRYGSAWLARPLPDEIAAEIRDMFAR